jgi:hypothetical protein
MLTDKTDDVRKVLRETPLRTPAEAQMQARMEETAAERQSRSSYPPQFHIDRFITVYEIRGNREAFEMLLKLINDAYDLTELSSVELAFYQNLKKVLE